MIGVVLRIEDSTLEEPFMVLAEDEEHAARLAVEYLRIAWPAAAPDGERMKIPAEEPVWGWANWLNEAMHDVEDVTITAWSLQRRDLMEGTGFLAWLASNAEALAKQHASHVQDVIFLDERKTL